MFRFWWLRRYMAENDGGGGDGGGGGGGNAGGGNNNGGGGGAAGGGGNSGGNNNNGGGSGGGGEPSGRTTETIVTLRAENAARRLKIEELEGTVARKDREITETKAGVTRQVEEAVKPHKEKLTAAQKRIVDAEIRAQAASTGLADLDLLPLLERGEITIDEDFNVKGVDTAFTKMKEKKPEWFRAGNNGAGGGGGGGSGGGAGGGGGGEGSRRTGEGARPAGGGGVPPKNAREMSREEYATARAARRQRLRGAR